MASARASSSRSATSHGALASRSCAAASLPFETADELAEMTEDVYLPQLPPDEFPYLNESAAALVAAGYDPAEEFTFGLDLVLAALEAPESLRVATLRVERGLGISERIRLRSSLDVPSAGPLSTVA